MIICS